MSSEMQSIKTGQHKAINVYALTFGVALRTGAGIVVVTPGARVLYPGFTTAAEGARGELLLSGANRTKSILVYGDGHVEQLGVLTRPYFDEFGKVREARLPPGYKPHQVAWVVATNIFMEKDTAYLVREDGKVLMCAWRHYEVNRGLVFQKHHGESETLVCIPGHLERTVKPYFKKSIFSVDRLGHLMEVFITPGMVFVRRVEVENK